ncbi:MAG: FHA domain-containing serine/threonine-protein kinase [Planctomycetota bacterium]
MAKIVLSEAGSIREVVLNDQAVIGRGADCDLVISEPKASRKHCNLTRHGDSWVITDLKSSNGTNLNGKRVETDEIINQGDRIVIGVTDIVFQSIDEPDPDHLEPGAFIGGYILQKEITRLSTGIVFEALQLSLKRKVTLHIVASKLANDRAFAKRFIADAKQAAKYNHTAIAAPIDVGAYQGVLYVARPEASRGTLEQVVAEKGAFTESAAIKIIRSLIDGVSVLHRQKQYHFNICPSSVFVSDDGEPKLAEIEFAAARVLPDTQSAKGRFADIPLSDPGFVAPEAVTADATMGAQSDAYSIACLLYFLTTGVRPFGEGTYDKILSRNMKDKRPDPERSNNSLAPSLVKFIKTGMAIDPAERFATIDAMAADMDALKARIGKTGPQRASISSEPSGSTPVDAQTVSSNAGRGFYYLLLLGNILLVAAAVIASGLLWLPDNAFIEKLNVRYMPFRPPETVETPRVRPTENTPVVNGHVMPEPIPTPTPPVVDPPNHTTQPPVNEPDNTVKASVETALAAAQAMIAESDLVGARRTLKTFIQRNEKRTEYANEIISVKRLHDEVNERINTICRDSWRSAKMYSEAKRWPDARAAAMKAIAVDPSNHYAIECAQTLAQNDAATESKFRSSETQIHKFLRAGEFDRASTTIRTALNDDRLDGTQWGTALKTLDALVMSSKRAYDLMIARFEPFYNNQTKKVSLSFGGRARDVVAIRGFEVRFNWGQPVQFKDFPIDAFQQMLTRLGIKEPPELIDASALMAAAENTNAAVAMLSGLIQNPAVSSDAARMLKRISRDSSVNFYDFSSVLDLQDWDVLSGNWEMRDDRWTSRAKTGGAIRWNSPPLACDGLKIALAFSGETGAPSAGVRLGDDARYVQITYDGSDILVVALLDDGKQQLLPVHQPSAGRSKRLEISVASGGLSFSFDGAQKRLPLNGLATLSGNLDIIVERAGVTIENVLILK